MIHFQRKLQESLLIHSIPEQQLNEISGEIPLESGHVQQEDGGKEGGLMMMRTRRRESRTGACNGEPECNVCKQRH